VFQSNRLISARVFVIALAALFIPVAAFPATDAVGVELKIASETVPPGGTFQMKINMTEPKPILKGRQAGTFKSDVFKGIKGIHLYSPDGDVSGVAVIRNGIARFSFSSPLSSFGMDADEPIMTIALAVSKTAQNGQTAKLGLDPKFSLCLNPDAQKYPVSLGPGTMTVGGTLSVANVVPGGGVVPAGSPITISGQGFQTDTKIDINEARIVSTTFISSTQMQVTLDQDTDMEGRRIRVENGNERVTYYSYQRTFPIGKSNHALVAQSYPLFDHTTWIDAYFKPTLRPPVFSGLALQNMTAGSVQVQLELYSQQGQLLTTRSVTLAANNRLVRDYAELFPGYTASTGTVVHVHSSAAIQMLGLLGNDDLGVVQPVAPASAP